MIKCVLNVINCIIKLILPSNYFISYVINCGAGPAPCAPSPLAPRQWRVFWVEQQPRAGGKVQLQGVRLCFSGGGSLRWDLSAFDPALRETPLSQSSTPVSPQPCRHMSRSFSPTWPPSTWRFGRRRSRKALLRWTLDVVRCRSRSVSPICLLVTPR